MMQQHVLLEYVDDVNFLEQGFLKPYFMNTKFGLFKTSGSVNDSNKINDLSRLTSLNIVLKLKNFY